MGPSHLWLTGAAELAVNRLHDLVGNGLVTLALLLGGWFAAAAVTGSLRKAVEPLPVGGASENDNGFSMHMILSAISWMPLGGAVGFLVVAGKMGWIGRGVLTTLDVLVTGFVAAAAVWTMFDVNGRDAPIRFGWHGDLPYVLPCGFLAFAFGVQFVDTMIIGLYGFVYSLLSGFLWSWVATLVAVVSAAFSAIVLGGALVGVLMMPGGDKPSPEDGATAPRKRRKASTVRKILAYTPPPRWVGYLDDALVEQAKAEWRAAQEEAREAAEETALARAAAQAGSHSPQSGASAPERPRAPAGGRRP